MKINNENRFFDFLTNLTEAHQKKSNLFFRVGTKKIYKVVDLDELIIFAIHGIFPKCFFLPVKV